MNQPHVYKRGVTLKPLLFKELRTLQPPVSAVIQHVVTPQGNNWRHGCYRKIIILLYKKFHNKFIFIEKKLERNIGLWWRIFCSKVVEGWVFKDLF